MIELLTKRSYNNNNNNQNKILKADKQLHRVQRLYRSIQCVRS